MARDLTDLQRARSRQLADEHPWIWLYEVEVPTDPATRYRLTNYDREIEFGVDSLGAPIVYSPLPLVHGDITESGEGDLPRIQIQLANDGLLLRDVMELYDGLVGQPITIRLVHSLELANPTASIRFDGQIVGAKATLDRVAWDVSALSLSHAVFPGQRYLRGHCRWRYGDSRCGYDLTSTTLAAAMPTCSKILEGATGCRAHGAAELAASVLVRHPQRFGGWPSLPRVSRK